jgi:hypothetical protein
VAKWGVVHETFTERREKEEIYLFFARKRYAEGEKVNEKKRIKDDRSPV